MTPMQRTLKQLRAEGWTCAIVEKRVPGKPITIDMGGFADIVAWAEGRGILAIQATSGDHVSHRLAKIAELETAKSWCLSPARLEVWGWRKTGARGKRKIWEVRRVPVAAIGPISDAVESTKEAR